MAPFEWVVGAEQLDNTGDILDGLAMEDRLGEGTAIVGNGHGEADEEGYDRS